MQSVPSWRAIAYLVGGATLALYVVWITTNMARSGPAEQRLIELALGLAVGSGAVFVGYLWRPRGNIQARESARSPARDVQGRTTRDGARDGRARRSRASIDPRRSAVDRGKSREGTATRGRRRGGSWASTRGPGNDRPVRGTARDAAAKQRTRASWPEERR